MNRTVLETDALETVAAPLLEARDLTVHFAARTATFGRIEVTRAVDGVSFSVSAGETLGLVGESGCGKTTTGRALLRLAPITKGEVRFDGIDLFSLSKTEMRASRRQLQIVFQDPFGSLNPRMSAGDIIGESLRTHGLYPGPSRQERINELFDQVGLPRSTVNRYPHQFSGGQRQRISIARALAVEPRLLVLDEPVSALDVSIQSQILNLLLELQGLLGLTYVFIAHDLAVVSQMSDHVAIMYLGVIVEQGPTADIYRNPYHPYTQSLFSAIPIPDPYLERRRHRITLTGEVPSPIDPPTGCRFYTRCPIAKSLCQEEIPVLRSVSEGHRVACHFAEQSQELMGLRTYQDERE